MMISTTPEVDALIQSSAPLIICVSGGKDSRLTTEETVAHVRGRGHTGRIVLCYSDLGVVVWQDAQGQCRQLADRFGLELKIVRRAAGGLMERWEKRWVDNVSRYVNLECVKLILPWSTPTMRFCTSELKTTIIQRWIRKEFNQPVICVLGIRRDEGRSSKTGRGAAPVFKPHEITTKNGKEKKPALPVGSVDWNPLVAVKTTTVFQILRASEIPLPDAYEVFGASRYSCCFCIMSSVLDLQAACRDPRNHDIYRRQCELEIASTFSFQSNLWLSDIAPHLLSPNQQVRLPISKEKAKARATVEATIPPHLLYEKGWPNFVPTLDEAKLLANVREQMATIMDLDLNYTTPRTIVQRYEELIRQKTEKPRTKTPRLSFPALTTVQPQIPVLFPI
jgi:3'-phosphoadenosine 5'-phosphosulfate sulfotransferase (PAPS reductase)/FAD synthetase